MMERSQAGRLHGHACTHAFVYLDACVCVRADAWRRTHVSPALVGAQGNCKP